MEDPVITVPCGHTFDKTSILAEIERKGECPMCREKLAPNGYVPLRNLKVCPSLFCDICFQSKQYQTWSVDTVVPYCN